MTGVYQGLLRPVLGRLGRVGVHGGLSGPIGAHKGVFGGRLGRMGTGKGPMGDHGTFFNIIAQNGEIRKGDFGIPYGEAAVWGVFCLQNKTMKLFLL